MFKARNLVIIIMSNLAKNGKNNVHFVLLLTVLLLPQ